MCIVAIAWQMWPDQPLVLLNNRDEFYARATAPLSQWADGELVAGRDLQSGGTWLAVHPSGRWAVLTNHREAPQQDGPTLSRGQLVADYVQSDQSPMTFARNIDLQAYPAFNLIVGTLTQAVVVSNRGTAPTPLASGVYVLSNGLIDQPWPKVERLRTRVTQEILPWVNAAGDTWLDYAFNVLADTQPANDDQLPDTGIGMTWEKILSSICINTPVYGTRTSSVLTLTQQGYRFVELDRMLDQRREHSQNWQR